MHRFTLVLLTLVGVVFAACKQPAGSDGVVDGVDPGTDIEGFLSGPDQVLPSGVVGEPYEASGFVEGGDPPYTWVLGDDQRMPGGLRLLEDGRIEGIPSEAGEHTFSVIATDTLGRTKRLLLTITVRLDPLVVACGETIGGQFEGNALGFGGVNFDQLDSLAWIAVEMPPPEDLVQRIELVFTMPSSPGTLYIQRPSELAGSWDLEDEYLSWYVNPPFTNQIIRLDPGTNPSLTGYLAQPTIPLLLAGQGRTQWQMEVRCSDGPVFERLPQYPTELGQPLDVDFDVWGPNGNIRIYTNDPLPEWMNWNEETGEVTGIAEEVGAWEFTVIAESVPTFEGEPIRRREGRSIIGVYEVQEASCDTAITVDNEQSYLEGEFTNYWDPRGYAVYRLDRAARPISAITMSLSGSEGHYLGFADPDPGWLKFFPGAWVTTSPTQARLPLDHRSMPATRHYVEAGEIYIIAASTSLNTPMSLQLDCDAGPRPDFAALPVIEPFVEADYTLRGIGGTPPYTFDILGLPTGLTARGDELVGTTSVRGAFSAVVEITDAEGATSTYGYPLFVGLSEACSDATAISCGDTVTGTFTNTYFADGNGPDSTRVFCHVDRGLSPIGFEVYSDGGEVRLDMGDPGANTSTMWGNNRYTYLGLVGSGSSAGVPLNTFSWPDLDDYENAAVRMAIRSYNPGDWSITLVCE